MQRVSPWRSAARTDQGKIRRRNEDAFLDCPQQGLWVVADGMGGHQGGDIASQLIVASLAELPAQVGFDDRVNGVRTCLHWLNRRLGQELTLTAGCRDSVMGSTVVALLIEGNRAAWLDWMTFGEWNVTDFVRWEAELVRALDPTRPIGTSARSFSPQRLAKRSFVKSVSTHPGAMLFTRTPRSAHSSASERVSWSIAAFVAP